MGGRSRDGGGRLVSNLIGRIGRRTSSKESREGSSKYVKALAWGTKKRINILLYKFTSVRKGKTTERIKRNIAPSNRTLSLVTCDKRNGSLDIEALTKLPE